MFEADINKAGIAWCIYCSSYHPDEFPTKYEMYKRMMYPNKMVLRQLKRLDKKLHLYRNKSCSLCGRSYDFSGELDESWKITARRVKQEFDYAGIYGVSDRSVDLVVSQCRKSVQTLFEQIPNLQYKIRGTGDFTEKDLEFFTSLTFSGQLALIISGAQEGRKMKLNPRDSSKILN